MIYTYKISQNPFVVTIEESGSAIVTQPHHPEAENLKPWETKKQAEAWAKEVTANLEDGYKQRLIDAETIPEPESLEEVSEEEVNQTE